MMHTPLAGDVLALMLGFIALGLYPSIPLYAEVVVEKLTGSRR